MSLRPPLKDRLVSPIDASSVARIRAGVATRGRPRSRGRWLAAAIAAAALAGLGVLAWPAPDAGAPLTVDGRPLTALEADTPRTVVFDEGSRITLRAGSRLVPRTNDGREVVLDLERGEIEVDVRPGAGRRWMIEARWATVEVVGTLFVVARDARRVEVSVQRGEVVVRGEQVVGRVRHLVAGQSLQVMAPPVPAARAPELAPPVREPPASVAEIEAPREPPATPPRTRAPAPPAPVDAVAALLASADAARAEGRHRDAADELAALVARHAGDRRAPLAAFTLARLQLDVLDEPAAALATLDRAIALGLPAPTILDARARRVEALARSGRVAEAREAATRFEAAHPDSPRIPEVRRWGRVDTP